MKDKFLFDPCKACKAEYGPGICSEYCQAKKEYIEKLSNLRMY